MLKYLIGIIGITMLMIIWVIVQNLWRRTFLDQQKDEDVLAGRSTCGSCGCGTICKNKEVELKK
jgi:hypothetical protein